MSSAVAKVLSVLAIFGAKELVDNAKDFTNARTRYDDEHYIPDHHFNSPTTTPKPKPVFCAHEHKCTPYQLCTKTISTGNTIGEYMIDLADTDERCGYLEKCCALSNIITDVAVGEIRKPLEYKSCSFAGDYAHQKRRHKDPTAPQLEALSLPWSVTILQNEEWQNKISFKCGGSLIAPNVVLTSASCFDSLLDMFGKKFIRTGDFASGGGKIQDRNILEVIKHDQYKMFMPGNDIALILLEKSFDLNVDVHPVCLPSATQQFKYGHCLVAGWPKSDNRGEMGIELLTDYAADKRRRYTFSMLSSERCKHEFLGVLNLDENKQLRNDLICIGKEAPEAKCYADQGTPIVCAVENTLDFYQVAIMKKQIHCDGFAMQGLNVNVLPFRQWIDDTLSERGIFI